MRQRVFFGALFCALVGVLGISVFHGPVAQGSIVTTVRPVIHPTSAVIGGVPVALYFPKNLPTDAPVQVLVVLHGMGGTGAAMIPQVATYADQYGWVVVAPDLPYNSNFRDAATLTREDPDLTARLAKMQDALPYTLGTAVASRAFYYGFSRGAQVAHRFALFYPERVRAVAAISAGSYTLPIVSTLYDNGRVRPLAYPFGVGDLQPVIGHPFNAAALEQVRFRVEVGGADTAVQDVPRAWDSYEGQNRVARAQSFTQALLRAGVPTSFHLYPGVGHTVTPDMARDACTFFATVVHPAIQPAHAPAV